MSTFEQFNLPKSLQKAIYDLGLTTPTPIQVKSFPVIMSGRDVMGIAQTGTGKTYAYLLPILKQWKFTPTHTPKVVIIVPTRELVVQVAEEVEKLTKYMSVRVLGVYGGVNINTQKTSVYQGVDVLVGTPGRMMDLALDNVVRFDEMQKLVIDEFDEILNLGFRFQITSILSMMRPKRQNILFSATMTDEVDELLDEYFDFPEEVSLAQSGTPLEKIQQFAYHVPNFLTKVNVLKHLLSQDEALERILIFINNKRVADILMDLLEEDFPGQFGVIHSNKSQNYRLNTMASFQAGEIRGIVTTDIMARGLDISDITHVINMQFSETPEQYIHRIGRTGRADKEGIAISLIAPTEEEFQVEAELLMEKELEILPVPEGIKIEEKRLEFEKDKKKVKFLMKKVKLEGGAAFHEKSDKNKQVNLGGPGKTKPRKTAPRNREVERKRAAKRKKK
ncbi:putative ATP-dependent RNA helicase [Flavobacterium cauense R2A-7]|uniref:ATP-dependent RNA helicase RhlE n=1 Tax=Flavobacterium cauense R2A-7 TaxID=1341154 RepID=V6S2A9_9FLAO|nr:DEAD/DEAH box helicase [Flavobacterium cauense]ESU18525.1 putative ATP-dependent RNA helicase [Flavobacterium cauense R2A-7]KGO80614.1 DEAD/DEAH box helicase [Flavobacterium cauense R2A-7]TWI11760.1 ATP-dependent RNA helicase RhlE [Flavobacterium cauense R2A-7]